MLINVVMAVPNHYVSCALEKEIKELNDFSIVERIPSGEELIKYIKTCDNQPDICILDIKMPKLNGYHTIVELRKICNKIGIIVFTDIRHPLALLLSQYSGVDGYILTDTRQDLKIALTEVYEGRTFFESKLERELDKIISQNDIKRNIPLLSKKEIEIMELCTKVLTTKEIAASMCVKTCTTRTHLERIYRKLNLQTKGDLIHLVQQIGIGKFGERKLL